MDVAAYFTDLGLLVERLWADSSHAEHAFPAAAAEAILTLPPPSGIDARGVLAHAATQPLPPQADPRSRFGQPPVTLFRSEAGFHVDALLWFDSTTAIHRHQFSGAFHVLEGCSLHVPYAFSEVHRLSDGLRFGHLEAQPAEVLRRGDTRRIVAGDDGIHSLFHLEHPSASLVIRTDLEPTASPQYSYLRPGIAFDPFFRPPTLMRKLEALFALNRVDPEVALATARRLVGELDHTRAFVLLTTWHQRVSWADSDVLVSDFTARFPTTPVDLHAAFRRLRRDDSLITRRALMHDVRHRLFLALLLNVEEWSERRKLVAALFPDADPDVVIAEIVGELADPKMRGASGLALEPDELERLQAALRAGDLECLDAALGALSSRARALELVAAFRD